MKAFATLSALLALTSTTSASAAGISFGTLFARGSPGPLGFTPGLKVPTDCFDTPEGPKCPAQLASGNLLVTGKHVTLSEEKPNEGTNLSSNTLLVDLINKSDKFFEVSTLSLFDFPAGFETKKCTFHFIHEGGNKTASNLYSVWELENNGTSATEQTTWATRPKRVKVVGLFDTKEAEQIAYPTRRFGAPFLSAFGVRPKPSDFIPQVHAFQCPKGGRVVFEVANSIKKRGTKALEVPGHLGLGIEILDTPTPWFGFKASVRGNHS
ncbi:hypothetical protein HOY80DRAFT_365308 [Tuber brumale]|nr:hypothetical protein HOY80DRAFT_365308 [Tuber brumale]